MLRLWGTSCLSGVVMSSVIFVQPLSAATVSQGLSLDQGQGFKQVANLTGAKTGDRVMASANGSGQIVYDDGCVVQVNPGQIVVIAPQSPCAAGAQTGIDPTYVVVGGAVVGGSVAAALLLTGNNSSPASP